MAATQPAFKPGQRVRVTVKAVPQREDARQTIARLMRQDPAVRRTLKGAQEHRGRTLVIRSRGGRPWATRKRVASLSRIEPGAAWSMLFLPQIARDVASVSAFLDIKPA